MTQLTIDQYNAFEAQARQHVPNLAQMAFAPQTFLELNNPAFIGQERDLLRFVDNMHELSGHEYFAPTTLVSQDEAALLEKLCDHTAELTERTLGRRMRPWTAPASAIEMVRLVTACAERLGKTQATVLEIGPGSGYFGALMRLAGHRHIAMDNTQAFYLWQNRLWSSLAGEGGFLELADPSLPLADDPSKTMVHIPWWRFCDLHKGNGFKVDFVVCDHALNEISTLALRYILSQVRGMLAPDGMILCCHLGHSQKRDDMGLFRELDKAGFEPLFKRLFFGFAPKGGKLAELAIPLDAMGAAPVWKRALVKWRRQTGIKGLANLAALDNGVPFYEPSRSGKRLKMADVLPNRPSEMADDYPFVAAAGYYVPAPAGGTRG